MTITVRTLLCHKDIKTGLKCLSSAKASIIEGVKFEIFDDGTLTGEDSASLSESLKDVRVIPKKERDALIKERLSPFPFCSKFREDFPLGMKLFDCSLFEEPAWVNYLDSDIFFLRKVKRLFSSTSNSLFMEDVDNAYSLRFPSFILAPPIIVKLNSGIMRFPASMLNLESLEKILSNRWIYSDLVKTPAWAEQTCFGMLAATVPTQLIDPRDGIVVSKNFKSGMEVGAVLIHVVSSYRSLLNELSSRGLEDSEPKEVKAKSARTLTALSYIFTFLRRLRFR